jgi:hypothetical protein
MAIDVHSASGHHRPAPFGFFFRRARERAAADQWLVTHTHPFSDDAVVRRRIAELTSVRERTRIAKSLLGAVRDARRPGISASPLSRRAIVECADELTELAERLLDLDQPVAPRGVVQVRRFLTDGSSPLYAHDRAAELAAETTRIRTSLEVASQLLHTNSGEQGREMDASHDDPDARVADPRLDPSVALEER